MTLKDNLLWDGVREKAKNETTVQELTSTLKEREFDISNLQEVCNLNIW